MKSRSGKQHYLLLHLIPNHIEVRTKHKAIWKFLWQDYSNRVKLRRPNIRIPFQFLPLRGKSIANHIWSQWEGSHRRYSLIRVDEEDREQYDPADQKNNLSRILL